MKITALVENHTQCELKAKHGLSLYIETKKHKILFDLGPDKTMFVNAKARDIDLINIDTVIISHGHIDHGGGLNHFLKINTKAKIYIQRTAFESYYSKVLFLKIGIGLNKKIKAHPQIVLIDGDYQIDEELSLFTVKETNKCYSSANDALYSRSGKDVFSHEHNLIISENEVALIMDCGHTGVVNIMEEAESYQPKICVGGFHFFNPVTKKTVSTALLNDVAKELRLYSETQFYTCHCTGVEAYEYLSHKLPNLFYLSCGEEIDI